MAPRASAIRFLLVAVFGAASARGAVFDPTFGVGGIASDVTSEPGGNVGSRSSPTRRRSTPPAAV
jgi:hypothetical protein